MPGENTEQPPSCPFGDHTDHSRRLCRLEKEDKENKRAIRGIWDGPYGVKSKIGSKAFFTILGLIVAVTMAFTGSTYVTLMTKIDTLQKTVHRIDKSTAVMAEKQITNEHRIGNIETDHEKMKYIFKP